MQLPLSFLIERTSDLIFWNNKEKEERLFSRPVFWTADIIPEKDIFYLIPEEEISSSYLIENICFWVGDEELCRFTENSVCYGTLKPGVSLWKAGNRFQTIYDKFESWERELMMLSAEPGEMLQMLRISSELLNYPMAVMNLQYHITASSTEEYALGGVPALDAQGFLSEEVIDTFKYDPVFRKVESSREVFLYTHDSMNGFFLCQNLFFRDTYVARLVSYSASGFPRWMYSFLPVLVKYLEELYSRELSVSHVENSAAGILSRMAESEEVSRTDQLQALHSLGWKENGHFSLSLLKVSAEDISNNTLAFYCHQLMTAFDDSAAFTKEDQIVFLMNFREQTDYPADFFQKFAVFIRDNNFRAGFSNIFTDFGQLRQFYLEAAIALVYGETKDASIWRHMFSEFALDYCIDQSISRIHPQNLCAQELIILKEYDRIHHTELYATLKSFLKNLQSPVQTARELYIQRGTLNYRIQRIRQLTGIDFSDFKKVLYLQYSFLVLERGWNSEENPGLF